MNITMLVKDFYVPEGERGSKMYISFRDANLTLLLPKKAHGFEVYAMPEPRIEKHLSGSNYVWIAYYDKNKEYIAHHILINACSFRELIENISIIVPDTLLQKIILQKAA